MSDCIHEIVGKTDRRATCRKCREEWSLDDVGDGPGSRLSRVLETLGERKCERCEVRELQMNLWGPEECWRRRVQVVKMMKHEAIRAISTGRVDNMIEQWLIREGVLDGSFGNK